MMDLVINRNFLEHNPIQLLKLGKGLAVTSSLQARCQMGYMYNQMGETLKYFPKRKPNPLSQFLLLVYPSKSPEERERETPKARRRGFKQFWELKYKRKFAEISLHSWKLLKIGRIFFLNPRQIKLILDCKVCEAGTCFMFCYLYRAMHTDGAT